MAGPRRSLTPSRAQDEHTVLVAVGVRLREAREARGLTLEAAAHRLGVGAQHLQRIETAAINPTLTTLARIAQNYPINLETLLSGRETPVAASVADEPVARPLRANPEGSQGAENAEQALTRIGQRILALRKQENVTRVALAARADITSQYLLGVERGRQNPSYKVLHALAKALGVPLLDLLA